MQCDLVNRISNERKKRQIEVVLSIAMRKTV